MQAIGGGGFSGGGGESPLGAGEVYPPRASFDVASMVGAAAAGGLPGHADGALAARPLRLKLPC